MHSRATEYFVMLLLFLLLEPHFSTPNRACPAGLPDSAPISLFGR